jgi:hypothetical protein
LPTKRNSRLQLECNDLFYYYYPLSAIILPLPNKDISLQISQNLQKSSNWGVELQMLILPWPRAPVYFGCHGGGAYRQEKLKNSATVFLRYLKISKFFFNISR